MTVQMWKTLEITAKKEKSLIPPLVAVQWMIYTSELLCNYSFWSLSWQRSYIFVVCQLFDLVYEWQPIRSKWWKWAETIFKRISLLIIQFSLGHWDNKNAGMCFALSYESPRKTTRSYRGARISLFPFIICRIVGAETVSLSQWGGKGWTTVYLRVDTKKSHSHLQDFISHHQHVFALQEETLKTEYTNSADKGLSWLRESNTWIFYCHDNWCRVLPCNANTNNQLIWSFSNVAWLKYFSMSQARQQ